MISFFVFRIHHLLYLLSSYRFQVSFLSFSHSVLFCVYFNFHVVSMKIGNIFRKVTHIYIYQQQYHIQRNNNARSSLFYTNTICRQQFSFFFSLVCVLRKISYSVFPFIAWLSSYFQHDFFVFFSIFVLLLPLDVQFVVVFSELFSLSLATQYLSTSKQQQ